MKDFVKEYWKIAAAFAAGAFLLSLLIGLVTRNPFGVVILRAFLLAAIFAGLGVGLRLVVRTYLPEISTPRGTSTGGTGAVDETRGSRVDIVLPEERPARRRPDVAEGTGAAGPQQMTTEPGEASALSDAGPAEDALAHAEAEALGELAEELAEELPPAAEGRDVGEDESGAEKSGPRANRGEPADVLSEVPSPEEMRGVPSPKEMRGVPSPDGPAGSGEEGGLDSLPDISNLEIAVEQGAGATGGRSKRHSGGDTPEDAIRGTVSRQDPATLAKAVRTVLKRDEKG